MKLVAVLFISILAFNVFAKTLRPDAQQKSSSSSSLVINVLYGSQFRFEDGADQARSLKSYSNFALTAIVHHDYWLGFETTSFKDSTGNPSLRIEREVIDYNLGAGYSLWRWQHTLSENNWHIEFNAIGAGYLGQNKQTITTQLLGTPSKDSSDPEWTTGLGALASFRLQYFLIEFDTRLMTSKAYEPQNVSVSTLRAGFSVPL